MTIQWRLLLTSFVILLGLAPAPREMFAHSLSPRGMSAWGLLFDLLALAPILPFAIALAAAIAHVRPSSAFVPLTFLTGVPLTLLATAFSGAGGLHVLGLGAATTLAIAGVIAATAHMPDGPGPRHFARICIGIALAAAIWSLAAAGAVVAGTQTLADGRPFCVAHHGEGRAVIGIVELRGARFFTTRTGCKDTADWFFHGLLLIDGPDGVEAWHWSPRALAFHPLRRIRRIAPVGDACIPRPGFWRGVGIF